MQIYCKSDNKYHYKNELPTKVSQLENDEGYLKEHQSLENYVTKDDAFSSDFNDLINASDISTLVTQEALDTKADKSEIPDITGLATEEYVDNAIASVGGGNAATVNGFSIERKTQEEYDALAVKDPNILYIIVE